MTEHDPPLPVLTGTASYYVERAQDFERRHPSLDTPSYYLDYGDRCLHLFLDAKPELSGTGQSWVDETLRLLQDAMEAKRSVDESAFDVLERDDDAFTEFAFGTHSAAYIDAGLLHLPATDIVKIAKTPDLSDLVSPDGLQAISDLLIELGGHDVARLLRESTSRSLWSSLLVEPTEKIRSLRRWLSERRRPTSA